MSVSSHLQRRYLRIVEIKVQYFLSSKLYITFSGKSVLICALSAKHHAHFVRLLNLLIFRAVKLRPDLSCLWKLLGDACTAVSTVSPDRAQVLMPALLVGLTIEAKDQMLGQSQTLKVGER